MIVLICGPSIDVPIVVIDAKGPYYKTTEQLLAMEITPLFLGEVGSMIRVRG